MKMKLPPNVVFHHDLRLMVYRPRGIINEKEVIRIVEFLEREEDRDERDQCGDAPAPMCEFSHGSSFRLDVRDARTSVFECREHAEPFGYRRRRAVGISRVSAPLTASSPRATLPWWVSDSSAQSRSRVGQLQ